MASTYTFGICVLFLNAVFAAPSYDAETTKHNYPFEFYSRRDWGAEPSTDLRPQKLPVSYVVIHHTYVPAACSTFKQCSADMRSMQRYHNSMDWGDIGYNFCVGSEGGAYEGRGWDVRGIHAGSANSVSVGICLIGDWRVELPPKKQLETVQKLIAAGVKMGKIRKDYKLIGHSQAMSTECPGTALLEEISTWNNFLAGNPDFTAVKTATTTS
ncbi:peptidoglycan-recognition protein LB-like [Anticarsia gemmatalis]|uniref:peptidoglycan-recognition protein LB-like n=1 Tax=Anticarsia gemmatalis TaxID=129554 RepID=UPI003F771B80